MSFSELGHQSFVSNALVASTGRPRQRHPGKRPGFSEKLGRFKFAATVLRTSRLMVGSESGAILVAPPCGGKTWAAEAAQEALSQKGVVTSVLILRCKFLNDVRDLRHYVAKMLKITGLREMDTQTLIDLAKKRMCKKHVRLLLLDDAHALSPDGQAFLFEIVRDIRDGQRKVHRVGLIALVTDGTDFKATAPKFGRFFKCDTLPPLDSTEVANYLVGECPALEAAMRDPAQREACLKLNRDLCLNSDGLPVLLHGLIHAVLADPALGEPTLGGFHQVLKHYLVR